jgi:Secretion system C-terminal sorting domain
LYNVEDNPVLFPNATTNILQIEANIKLAQIMVYDHIGMLVRSFAPSNQIDMQDLAAGLYLITLKNIHGDITTHKVIKID